MSPDRSEDDLYIVIIVVKNEPYGNNMRPSIFADGCYLSSQSADIRKVRISSLLISFIFQILIQKVA